jgi:hypothetical protein
MGTKSTDTSPEGLPRRSEDGAKDAGGGRPASSSDGRTRQVAVRLDVERFEALAAIAAREGLAPTAMARMFLHRAIREAERETQYLP